VSDSALGAGIGLSVDELLALARREAGVDLDDTEVREPLRRLLMSLNSESCLHAEGAAAMREKIVRNLANRLRMQRDFAAHPEIAEQPLKAPLIICGMARTGSTKMQKLLASSGDFNWLPYWQVFNPSLLSGDPTESPRPRIEDCDRFARWFDAASPGNKAAHPFSTHEPEEESFILEHSLKSPVLMGWAPMPGYLTWLMSTDMSAQFTLLRDTLKYLQWQGLARPDRPWVLKSPLYSGLEPLLLAAFPDARLLMTHRTPVQSIPSGLQVLRCFYKPFTRAEPDPQFYVRGQAGAVAQHLSNRDSLPKGTFLDLHFRDINHATAEVIARIYDFAGLPLAAEPMQRMQRWMQDNPQHRYGRHEYSLDQFGLDEASLRAQFAGYMALVDSL
jgi:hypothetical protein